MSSESESEEFYDAVDVTPKLSEDAIQVEGRRPTEIPCVQDSKLKKSFASVTVEPVFSIRKTVCPGGLSHAVADCNCQRGSRDGPTSSDSVGMAEVASHPFKVPLPVTSTGAPVMSRHSWNKRTEESSLAIGRGGGEDRISIAEDSCSSLSGSLLGNLRDDDEPTAPPTTRVSTARHRRRHAAASATPTPPTSPPQHQHHHDGAGCPSCGGSSCCPVVVQPFRVVEPDASSLHGISSTPKLGGCSGADSISRADQCLLSSHSRPPSVSCTTDKLTTRASTTSLGSLEADTSPSPSFSTSTPSKSLSRPASSDTLLAVDAAERHELRALTTASSTEHTQPLVTGLVLSAEPDLVASTKTSGNVILTRPTSTTDTPSPGLCAAPYKQEQHDSTDHTTDPTASTPSTADTIVANSPTPSMQFYPAVQHIDDSALAGVGPSSSSTNDVPASNSCLNSRAAYAATPFSSQSLPASCPPPRAPLSLARRHRSHPALLHISVVDPTRGIDHLTNVAEAIGKHPVASDCPSTGPRCDSFTNPPHGSSLATGVNHEKFGVSSTNTAQMKSNTSHDGVKHPTATTSEPSSSQLYKKPLLDAVENNVVGLVMSENLLSKLQHPMSEAPSDSPPTDTLLHFGDGAGLEMPVTDSGDVPVTDTAMPPPPVAPPRKRRRKKQAADDDSVSVSSACSSVASTRPDPCPQTIITSRTVPTHSQTPQPTRHAAPSITSSLANNTLSASQPSLLDSFNTPTTPTIISSTPLPPRTIFPSASHADISAKCDKRPLPASHSQSNLNLSNITAPDPAPFVITTTAPTPPRSPLTARKTLDAFRLSSISKRSSKLLKSRKKLVGLSSLLPGLGKGTAAVEDGGAGERISLGKGAADTISIGRRSLDIRAAIMGKFLVKDFGRTSPDVAPQAAPAPRQELKASPSPDGNLSDQEILSQVSLLNLDTGVRVTLSDAPLTPNPLNPLSLQIMKLTNRPCSGEEGNSDDNSSVASSTRDSDGDGAPPLAHSVKKKTVKMKKLLERRVGSAVLRAAKSITARSTDDKDVFADDAPTQSTGTYVKIKTAHGHKGPHEWDDLMYVQEITGEHLGPVWCAKFSLCGRLLATAGQDQLLRVWVIKQAYHFFLDIRTKYNPDIKVSPTPSEESLSSVDGSASDDPSPLDPGDHGHAPFMPSPFCVYEGHSADLLDVAWSKNYFLLTSSMDKTVRLWHISRKECLCIFQHVDFVTAIAFHPKDDRYFISGSLDGKLRLWSIPEKRVVLWTEVQDAFITAANFCQNGAYTVVGTYDGRCLFYTTNQLKYNTQFNVRSARGKNSKGKKITGIESVPGENKVLVTSNDSRIRLYGLDEHSEHCKYRGLSNTSSQIRASFSHDGKYIVAGSENQCIYLWRTHHDHGRGGATARRDRNAYWEGVKAHSAVVTCALFSPHPELVFNFIEQQELQQQQQQQQQVQQQPQQSTTTSTSSNSSGDSKQQKHDSLGNNKGYMLVSADFNGCIKVFLKKEKPKHSSLPASALA